MNQIIPNFIIAGPPKCASTSLYFYLKQHPEIFMSTEKQTKFFSLDYDKGVEFYLKNYFTGISSEKAAGEATPTYSFLPFVAERIKKFNPEMKFIFCLRNPVERTFSAWNMRVGLGTENLSFKDALNENIKARDKGINNFNGDEGAKLWYNDQRINNKNPDKSLRTYLEGSMYAENLKSWYSYFDPSQIKVVFFDALSKNQDAVLKEIFMFLDVDPEFKVKNTERKNTAKKSKIAFLEPILGKKKPLALFMSKAVPSFIKKKAVSAMYVEGTKERVTEEERKFAYPFFKDDIKELEKMLNADLSRWKLN